MQPKVVFSREEMQDLLDKINKIEIYNDVSKNDAITFGDIYIEIRDLKETLSKIKELAGGS